MWHETNFCDKAEKHEIFENILLPIIHLYTLIGITVPKKFSLPHLLTVIILIMLVSVLALGGIFRLILYILDVEYNNYCNFAKFAFPQTFTQNSSNFIRFASYF